MNEEDEAFNEIERMSSVRQEILRTLNRKRQIQEIEREFDEEYIKYRDAFPRKEYVFPFHRNDTLEEVAVELEKNFNLPFGRDTVASFATFIRGMKK